MFYVTPKTISRNHGGSYRETDCSSVPRSHRVTEIAGAVRVVVSLVIWSMSSELSMLVLIKQELDDEHVLSGGRHRAWDVGGVRSAEQYMPFLLLIGCEFVVLAGHSAAIGQI